jgi:hypothetical protein
MDALGVGRAAGRRHEANAQRLSSTCGTCSCSGPPASSWRPICLTIYMSYRIFSNDGRSDRDRRVRDVVRRARRAAPHPGCGGCQEVGNRRRSIGHPSSSAIHGASFALRELRIKSSGHALRVFYAFDPRRDAVLIIGGDKTGQNSDDFYRRMIAEAEHIWKDYLAEQALGEHDDE